jgi:hypothetical protein
VRGVETSGRREKVGKGCKRVNMVKILCTHECKWKKIPVATSSQIGGWEIKESGEGGEFKYDIFDILSEPL